MASKEVSKIEVRGKAACCRSKLFRKEFTCSCLDVAKIQLKENKEGRLNARIYGGEGTCLAKVRTFSADASDMRCAFAFLRHMIELGIPVEGRRKQVSMSGACCRTDLCLFNRTISF